MKKIKIDSYVNCWEKTNLYRRAYNIENNIEKSYQAEIETIYRSNINPNEVQIFSNLWKRCYDIYRFYNFSRKRNNPDLIHLYDPCFPSFYYPIRISKKKGVPLLVDMGDLHTTLAKLSGRSKLDIILMDKIEKMSYQNATNIVVRSKGHIEFIEHMGISSEKIHYIPDGVELKFFKPAISDLKKEMKLEEKIVIGYIGRLRGIIIESSIYPRGWELLQIAKKLVESGYKNICVLIIGTGSAFGYLQNMISEMGLKDYVILTGYVNDRDVPKYINMMDICFQEMYDTPIYKSMTPTKIKEYMSCGRCVISVDIGEVSHWLNNGCGFLVNPSPLKTSSLKQYIKQLFETVVMLINDKNLRERTGNNARKKAEKLFNWNKISEIMYEVYVDTIENVR